PGAVSAYTADRGALSAGRREQERDPLSPEPQVGMSRERNRQQRLAGGTRGGNNPMSRRGRSGPHQYKHGALPSKSPPSPQALGYGLPRALRRRPTLNGRALVVGYQRY